MPWWGWLLFGLAVGACVVTVFAAFIVSRRRPAPGHAEALAAAEAEVDRLNVRVSELRLAHVADAERAALPVAADTKAAALEGDTGAQVGVVMGFLGGDKPS